MALDTEIRNYRLGGFKRYGLTVAEDDGWGASEFVGGFDTSDEAREAARAIEAKCDELIRDGYALVTDPRVRPYFWLAEDHETIEAGASL